MTRDTLLVAMLRAGRSDTRIAAVLGLSPWAVCERRRALGIVRVRGKRVSLIGHRQRAEAANDMLWEGVPRAVICERLGVSARTLARYIRPDLRGVLPARYSGESRRKAAEHMRAIQKLGAAATGRRWAWRRAAFDTNAQDHEQAGPVPVLVPVLPHLARAAHWTLVEAATEQGTAPLAGRAPAGAAGSGERGRLQDVVTCV